MAVDLSEVASVEADGERFAARVAGLGLEGTGVTEEEAMLVLRRNLALAMSDREFRARFGAWMRRVARPVSEDEYRSALSQAALEDQTENHRSDDPLGSPG
ncbi:MAG: hypothetical protein ACLGH3_01910 [Actinomycetota bacterium]